MTTEEYIYRKLGKLSKQEQKEVEKIEKVLGEWATVQEVSQFLSLHTNTVYQKVRDDLVISKKTSKGIFILSKSLIFLD